VLLHRLLWEGAERVPDRPALVWIDRARSLTYAESVAATERVAGALAALGVGRGDRVAVFAHNGLDYLLAMFGAWRLGAISALVNVAYADELDTFLADCDPAIVIYTGDHHPTIERVRPRLPGVRHWICLDGPAEGSISWPELAANPASAPADTTSEDDIAHLSYTSGTSGPPKGACLAHEPTARATRCIAERLRMTSTDVSVGPTALSSSYQLVANLLPVLHRHGTACVIGKWEPERGWEQLSNAGATVLAANPPVLTGLLRECGRRGGAPPALRLAVSGGGPVAPQLKWDWWNELQIPLAESYGQSELGGFVGLGFPEPPDPERLLACGPPLPDKEVRIVDDTGGAAPIGDIGEIVLRGGFMAGYWRRPEKTAEALRDGWLHTGDVGRVDADDNVYLRGRLSERITVAGTHWYPRDVEEALLQHPAVDEVAVVGIAHDGLGQRPVAFVTTPPDGLPVHEVVATAAAALDHLDLSVLAVESIDAMPMTPTGKISKAQLLAAYSGRSQ
jgi:long-chain acyl-CoA synthetase